MVIYFINDIKQNKYHDDNLHFVLFTATGYKPDFFPTVVWLLKTKDVGHCLNMWDTGTKDKNDVQSNLKWDTWSPKTVTIFIHKKKNKKQNISYELKSSLKDFCVRLIQLFF